MKLISWNVNGIRAVIGKGFLDFIKESDADVYCLQETKARPEQVDLDLPSYHAFWNAAEKKGYSGTLILSKVEPLSVSYGFGIEEHDREGRVITAEFDEFFLVNVYTPNAQRELTRLDYRQEWDKVFLKHLKKLEKMKPVITCGDFNVAHEEIDLARPKSNVGNAGFTDEERGGFSEYVAAGFLDSWRHLHPDTRDIYSWWSFRANARSNNVGWRIDYFLVSKALEERLRGAFILGEVKGSDHCPVGIVLGVKG